jgi:hypothetical protein
VQAHEINSQAAKLLQGVHQLPQATGKAVISVYHDGIHLPLSASDEQTVQLRPMLFGPADAAINVFASNGPTAAGTILPQFPQLHFGVLAVMGRNTSIDGDLLKQGS